MCWIKENWKTSKACQCWGLAAGTVRKKLAVPEENCQAETLVGGITINYIHTFFSIADMKPYD